MMSTLSRQEKFNQVRRKFCFYLDIQDHGLCKSLSRRLQDMGLQQEAFLSSRVTHVVRGAGERDAGEGHAGAEAGPRWRREPGRARADAMLERVRGAPTRHEYVLLSVEKAIALLDKLYDTFFTAPRKTNVRLFTKHFIKIEFLDKQCRPLYKEFDEWPGISLEPNPQREKERKEQKESTLKQEVTVNNNHNNNIDQNCEMTRKNRPRIKEKEEAEGAGGWCAACGTGCLCGGAGAGAGAGVDPLLGGERRSLRHLCNGELNGALEPERRARRNDRHYYKVVGVSTKLRSSGGFAPKPKDSPPPCNGTAKPLVVKFRKVRRSELSVLSDEAEQFMFPKRASSTSSASSDSEAPRRRTPPRPALERRRQARPTALKEESSEEDAWPGDPRRRRRRAAAVARRSRRTPREPPAPEPEPPPEPEPEPPVKLEVPPEPEPSPLREEPVERCMKWEDGRLKYTPAVEQLEFAFESVPRSEPWYETFERQDRDRVTVRNVPRCFALYSKSPKLPYEIGQLPPPRPDCCPLSALPAPRAPAPRPRPAPARRTRGAARRGPRAAPAPPRPRKSPREHASTLAMLGSAGLLRRAPGPGPGPDDAKSTASEDTAGAPDPPPPGAREAGEAGERLRRFLASVFDDAAEYELDEVEGGALPAAAGPPDVLGLVSECDSCDILRHELACAARRRPRRRPRLKRKNRTGWPSRKRKKGSRATSSEDRRTGSSLDGSSVGSSGAAADTCDEEDASETEEDAAPARVKSEDVAMEVDGDEPLRLDVKVLLEDKKDEAPAKGSARSSASEPEDREERVRRKKRALTNLGSWLQPVVRVARVDPAAARRLRSAGAGAGAGAEAGAGAGAGRTRAARLR